jgi:hypothetical protein
LRRHVLDKVPEGKEVQGRGRLREQRLPAAY